MSIITDKKDHITFSPGLHAGDPLANYWMRQVTTRLRREICWCWHERGMLPNESPATMPPFSDKVSAILDMSRFWEEKNKFFQTDPTARYLTEQVEVDTPCADQQSVQGSLGWVVERLHLDDISSFVLALGLAVTFDNAIGSVVAACLNDSTKTHPNLALAQKLWDYPEEVFMLVDPAHPLFRYGLLQHRGQTLHNYSEVDWESPITVPSVVANQLLFPDSFLPQSLIPISIKNNQELVFTDTARLVAARLNSKIADKLCIVPVLGPRGSTSIETVRGIAKAAQRDVVEFKGEHNLLDNNHYLNSLATLCWLIGVDLFLSKDSVSVLTSDKHHSDVRLLPLQTIPITIFFSIQERSQLKTIPGNLLLPVVEVSGFSYHERMDHWKEAMGEKARGLDSTISECSRRFRYEKETINAICEGLKGFSSPISEKDFIGACRAELELDMGELDQKVIPRFNDDEELILPQKQYLQFQEIVKAMKSLTEVHYGWETGRVWNESGISLLFAGPPGTGKTMAAEILAIKLELPMYRIDLSQVVNKYMGEPERNLNGLL